MGIPKPTIDSMTLIKPINTKRQIKAKVNPPTSSNDSISTNEKPFLITYQAIPMSTADQQNKFKYFSH